MISPFAAGFKRLFDIVLAVVGLLVVGWFVAVLWVIITLLYKENAFFSQVRVGRFGEPFRIYKLRTMHSPHDELSTVTTATDVRITGLGRLLRRAKFDELPQLWNVLRGDMSLVGPRPDVPGYADALRGDDRIVLSVRPGITGPASLFFRKEELLLSRVDNPVEYNDSVIWPEKVRINWRYVENYSFFGDLWWLFYTFVPGLEIPFERLLGYKPGVDENEDS